jgi:hypothetical protein
VDKPKGQVRFDEDVEANSNLLTFILPDKHKKEVDDEEPDEKIDLSQFDDENEITQS